MRRYFVAILLVFALSLDVFSQNYAVGSFVGDFNVGNLGEATYSVPIELPDGINGTTPKLSIEYNSNAGNDMLGVGFSIGGLSAVSRVGKNIYYDGLAKGINYSNGDEFALDGVRIIKLSTNNYALENDPTIEISRAASFAQADFIVKSNGNTMTYGSKVRGIGNVAKWLLSDVCDVFGNHIKYTYVNDGHPAAISYSGHSVKFIYENRLDTVRTILNGRKINSVSRLKQISVNKHGTLWRTYDCQYNTTDGVSRLSKITVKNAKGEQLPPMTFSYNTAAIGQTAKRFLIGNNARWEKNLVNFYDQTIVTGDYDTDGLDDIILTAQVNVPTGANTGEIYTSAIFYKNVGTNGTPSFRFANSINIGACWYDEFYNLGVNIMDFDGDGKNEFFVPMYNGPFKQVVFRFYDGMRAKYYLAADLKTSNEMPVFAVSDFIGNGKFAIFFIEKGKDKIGKYPSKIMCFDDNFSKKLEASVSFSLPSAPTNIFSSDYNGDGMIDILVLYDGGYTIYWNTGNGISYSSFSDASKCSGTTIKNCALIRPGDFNGDGYMDFVMSESDVDAIYWAINNGDGTFTKKTAISGLGIYDHSNTGKDDDNFDFKILDFNGDGKSDIVATKAMFNKKKNMWNQKWWRYDKTYTYWLKSDGNKLVKTRTATSNKETDSYARCTAVGDFDGDGMQELINFGHNCMTATNTDAEGSWRIYQNYNNSPSHGKLTSVNNNCGKRIAITYSSLIDKNIYTKGNGSKYPLVDIGPNPLSVVSQSVNDDGTHIQTFKYTFSGLLAHLQGKGILGFNKTYSINTTTNQAVTTEIKSWNSTFIVPSKILRTCTIDTAKTTDETSISVSSLGNKRYFAYPKTIVSTDIYGDKTTTTNSYNTTYGYIMSQKSVTPRGNIKAVEYKDYTKYNGIYKPCRILSIQKHPDDKNGDTITTFYSYNANSTLAYHIDNYQTQNSFMTTYQYDTHGNITKTTLTGNGIPGLSTVNTYDKTGAFLTSTLDASLGLTTKYTYDALGNIVQVTDSTISDKKVLSTKHKYDSWGRNISTSYPDGSTTSTTYGWDDISKGNYHIFVSSNAAPTQKTWYNNLGQIIKSETIGNGFIKHMVANRYNILGDIISKSVYDNNITNTTTYNYDAQYRLIEQKESTGKVTKYSYGKGVVTTTENGRTYRRYTDDWGNPTTITDPVSSVRYTYKSNGQPCKIVSGGATFTIEYNPDGTRKSISDPDAGKTTYEYDALGRVIRQTDGRGVVTTNKYSGKKLVKTTCGNEITEYKYNSFGELTEQKNSTATIFYQYNNRNLVELETYSIDGKQFKYTYRYNLAGQLTSCTYPDGVTETYNYDPNHLLFSIQIGGQKVWMLQSHTGTTLTEQFGSKLIKTTTYTNQGILSNTKIKTNDNKILHSMSYGFQSSTGNLVYRGGMSDNGNEHFQYDKADRLVATERMNISYSANGNILNKTGLGNYAYSLQKPHAVVYVQNTDTLLTSPLCKITYTPFGKVSSIKKQNIDGSNSDLSIHYGPDFNRIKTVSAINGRRVTIYHLPNYEEVYDMQGFTRYHYIDGAYGLVAVRISGDKGSNRTEYAFTDHLGSITRVYDENGNERFSASYDPFGLRTISNSKTPLQRGYCGHLHYDHFGLIDMGGRVYDPILGRFLSPDTYVQAPENSQNFNRFSYCLNNPLKYNDPTGEFVWAPVIALASIFAVGNLSTHLAAGDCKNFGQGIKMFAQGAIVGATLGAGAQIPGVSSFLGGLWNINKWGFSAMGTATLGSAFIGLVSGKNKKVFPNSLKMIGGLFSLDDSNFFRGIWQGISRFTWESLQTNVGLCYALGSNVGWRIDYVNYLGGATYSVNEYSKKNDGVTMGNYIGINIDDKVSGNFGDYARTSHGGLFMHEYGHTIQGRRYGFAYLFAIGIPSLKSAMNSKNVPYGGGMISSHRLMWFEMEASSYAKKYFGSNWTPYIESKHPTR